MKLKKWLFINRMSQSEFARQTGISRNYIHIITIGKMVPGKRVASIIFEFTNEEVSPADMGAEGYAITKSSRKTTAVDMVVL